MVMGVDRERGGVHQRVTNFSEIGRSSGDPLHRMVTTVNECQLQNCLIKKKGQAWWPKSEIPALWVDMVGGSLVVRSLRPAWPK